MKLKLTYLSWAVLLAGCATPPALQQTASDFKPENIRTLIAKEVLGTMAFGSISLIKAKIINATISAPSRETVTFSGKPYVSYCVNAFIENPLFPIHMLVSADVRILTINEKPFALARARQNKHCDGTGFEPFPEIERLSLARYAQS